MKSKQSRKSTGITFPMNAQTNRLLSQAISKSKRSKRTEAAIRLEDHLLRFISIPEVGEVKEREPNKEVKAKCL